MQPELQTQWWYINGFLQGTEGKCWEYELVFFRRNTDHDYLGLFPMRWIQPDIGISHFSLVDLKNDTFQFWHQGGLFSELRPRFHSRSLHAELGDWRIRQDYAGKFHIQVIAEGHELNLELESTKKPVLHGKGGRSPRSPHARFDSMHLSYTRLRGEGSLRIQDRFHAVSGESWLEHEKMHAPPDRFIHGWDWCSIQIINKQ
jgi:predicted secreted hydrolase